MITPPDKQEMNRRIEQANGILWHRIDEAGAKKGLTTTRALAEFCDVDYETITPSRRKRGDTLTGPGIDLYGKIMTKCGEALPDLSPAALYGELKQLAARHRFSLSKMARLSWLNKNYFADELRFDGEGNVKPITLASYIRPFLAMGEAVPLLDIPAPTLPQMTHNGKIMTQTAEDDDGLRPKKLLRFSFQNRQPL